MNKALLPLLLFTITISFAASELTTIDEPEKDYDTQQAAILKSAGLTSSFKSSKRVFLRDGVRVAALVATADTVGDKPPIVGKFVQFHIDADNWVEINLTDPRIFSSHLVTEVRVSSTKDSITVSAPKKRYCEVFYKSSGTFMDGAERERFAPGLLGGVLTPR